MATSMKNIAPALVAAVALASSSIACSSAEESKEVDTNAAISALQAPTGTLTRESASKAFGGYRQQRADSSKVATPTSNSGGIAVQSHTIKFLDNARATGACSSGGSCACPNGGSMSYSGEQTANGALVKVKMESCGFEDGFSFDGGAILLASKKSILNIPASSSPSAPTKPSEGGSGDSSLGGSGVSDAPSSGYGNGYVAFLVAAKGTASWGSNKAHLEFALLTEAQYSFLAVKVNDGSIVIGVRADGHALIRTKNGTWTCTTSGTQWVCTSENGEKIDVAEESGAGDVSEAPSAPKPPTGSSSSAPAPVPPPSGSDG